MTHTPHPHTPHPRLASHKSEGASTIAAELSGFNGWLAVKITNAVGTMWCAYAFSALALISLPEAIRAGTGPLIAWIAQTFLQLVLLSIIMVGQKVAAQASDKQAYQTYKDAEALLAISDDLQKLITLNNQMTAEIHTLLTNQERSPPTPHNPHTPHTPLPLIPFPHKPPP